MSTNDWENHQLMRYFKKQHDEALAIVRKLEEIIADLENPPEEAREYAVTGHFEIKVVLANKESFNANRIFEFAHHSGAPIKKVVIHHPNSNLDIVPVEGYKVDSTMHAGLTAHHLKISWRKL